MEELNINKILDREQIAENIKNILTNFQQNKNDLLLKKGIYIYGNPGSGKTKFIMNILKEMNYDVIKYDAGDIRNKSIIEAITKHNMSDKNIMSLFYKKVKQIAIVMDEIDGMNNGDKGGINSLIKLIRPKKTKKQKLEEITMNPIICIGNYHMDKKIKELIKVCHSIELKSPTCLQVSSIVEQLFPYKKDSSNLNESTSDQVNFHENIIKFIQGDLRKLNTVYEMYKNKESILKKEILQNVFQMKSYNDDTKIITKKLIHNSYRIEDHSTLMNETDRTIVGLLWHENIVDVFEKMKPDISIPFYLKLLDNMCFADYIDRTTFQKQIWQFNEMSSIIKTFKNNKLYHDTFTGKKKPKYNPSEVRFTKVLTKYSTEFNNSTFIQHLCQELCMDKKNIFSFFVELKKKYLDMSIESDVQDIFENSDVTKLDINRIYRYIEKYVNENGCEGLEDNIDSEEIYENEMNSSALE
jgi:hypothetical protein